MVVLGAFTEFNKIKYDCSKLIFLLYDGFMHLQVDGLDYQPLFAKMSPHSSPGVGGGGWHSHIKVTGMVFGKLNLNP